MASTSASGDALCMYDSVVRGHHVYQAIWTPYSGEMLLAKKEPANAHDRRAVCIVTSEQTIVGHVPREVASISGSFLVMVGTLHAKSQVIGDMAMVWKFRANTGCKETKNWCAS